jgi:hypothetical protein
MVILYVKNRFGLSVFYFQLLECILQASWDKEVNGTKPFPSVRPPCGLYYKSFTIVITSFTSVARLSKDHNDHKLRSKLKHSLRS